MSEQAEGKSATPREQHIGCFAWAERHPGVVLLSALAMAVLALPKSPFSLVWCEFLRLQ
jgi:hypothetical protein